VVRIMQNSALSFMVAGDHRKNTDLILQALNDAGFEPKLEENLQLLTVYNSDEMPAKLKGKTILMQQQTASSAHYLYR
jgi:Flp pilus assembly protein TadD